MRVGSLTAPQALGFSALLLACLLLPAALLALWPTPPGNYLLWDWANGMGYLVLAISLFLFVYKGRPRAYPAYTGRFFANFHRDLGYIAFALLAGHVGILLWAEPLLVEHLKPAAPLHMLAGLMAFLLMLLLVLSSIPSLRRRLWPDYHLFRHVHAVVAVAIIALTMYHVCFSAFYLNTQWKAAVLLLLGVVVTLYYASSHAPVPSVPASRSRRSARYSHVISYSCVLLAVLVCLALAFGNNLS